MRTWFERLFGLKLDGLIGLREYLASGKAPQWLQAEVSRAGIENIRRTLVNGSNVRFGGPNGEKVVITPSSQFVNEEPYLGPHGCNSKNWPAGVP